MDNYLANGSRKANPFDEEEVDDEEFLRHPRAGNSGYVLPVHNQNNRPQARFTNHQGVRGV
jgi:hypothetical protein